MSTSTASVVVHVWPLRARFTEIFIRVKVAQSTNLPAKRLNSETHNRAAESSIPAQLFRRLFSETWWRTCAEFEVRLGSSAPTQHPNSTPPAPCPPLCAGAQRSAPHCVTWPPLGLSIPRPATPPAGAHATVRSTCPCLLIRWIFEEWFTVQRHYSVCVPARGPHGPFLQWFSKDSASVNQGTFLHGSLFCETTRRCAGRELTYKILDTESNRTTLL